MSSRTVMLKVHTQKLGDISILCLQGRIAIGETMVLRTAVLSQLNVRVLVLDLARVNGVDAHGLGMLLELRERTQSRRIEFRLVNVTRPVQQVFEITCLDTVFDISSEQDARFVSVGPRDADKVSPGRKERKARDQHAKRI